MRKPNNQPPRVPWVQQPNRTRTDPAVAMAYAAKGWSWGGKRYASRGDWESDVLRYHGNFTLPTI